MKSWTTTSEHPIPRCIISKIAPSPSLFGFYPIRCAGYSTFYNGVGIGPSELRTRSRRLVYRLHRGGFSHAVQESVLNAQVIQLKQSEPMQIPNTELLPPK